jgi:hypothetical protein
MPADAGIGFGLFEDLHGTPSSKACADQLREATGRHYGHAGRAFVAALSQDCTGNSTNVQRLRDGFVAQQVPAGASGQVYRVAQRFGLISAAGELAIAARLTGWPVGAALTAAARCFHVTRQPMRRWWRCGKARWYTVRDEQAVEARGGDQARQLRRHQPRPVWQRHARHNRWQGHGKTPPVFAVPRQAPALRVPYGATCWRAGRRHSPEAPLDSAPRGLPTPWLASKKLTLPPHAGLQSLVQGGGQGRRLLAPIESEGVILRLVVVGMLGAIGSRGRRADGGSRRGVAGSRVGTSTAA